MAAQFHYSMQIWKVTRKQRGWKLFEMENPRQIIHTVNKKYSEIFQMFPCVHAHSMLENFTSVHLGGNFRVKSNPK